MNLQQNKAKTVLAASYSPVKMIARPAPLSASTNEFLQIYPNADYSPINALHDSKLIKTFSSDLVHKNDELSKKINDKTQEIEFWKNRYEESLKSLPVTEKKLLLLIEENEYLKKAGSKKFDQEEIEKITKLEEGIQMVLSENDKLNSVLEEQLKNVENLKHQNVENESRMSNLEQENGRLMKLINEKDEEIFSLLEQKILLKEKVQEESENFQGRISEKNAEIERINSKLLENTDKFTDILKEKTKMIEDLQEKQRKEFEIQQSLQDKLVILLEENGKLNRVCEENNRNMNLYRDKISAFATERLNFEEFKQDLLLAKELIHEKESKILALNGQLLGTKNENEDFKHRINDLEKLLHDREEEIRGKEVIIREKESDIKGIEAELIELESESERKENEMKLLMSEKIKEINAKNQEINEYREKIYSLEDKIKEKDGQISNNNAKIEEVVVINERLKSTIEAIRQDLKDSQLKNVEYQVRNQELFSSYQDKEAQNECLSEKMKDLKMKFAVILETNEKLNDFFPDVLKNSNLKHEMEKTDFRELLAQKDEKISELSQYIEAILTENKKLIEKFQENRLCFENYQSKCNLVLDKVKLFLMDNNDKLEKSKFEEENQALKQKINELKQEIQRKNQLLLEFPQKTKEGSDDVPAQRPDTEVSKENKHVLPVKEIGDKYSYGEINDYVLRLRESLKGMKKGYESQKNKRNFREIKEMFENVQELKKGVLESFQIEGKSLLNLHEEINGRIEKIEEKGKNFYDKAEVF